jgi:hypothetical protein
MKLALVFTLVAACACPPAAKSVPPGTGSAVAAQGTCEAARAHVAALYRAEAEAREPKRVEEATADNTAMALADCAKDPATRGPCLASAATVADLERNCLTPLDDEGTEGKSL